MRRIKSTPIAFIESDNSMSWLANEFRIFNEFQSNTACVRSVHYPCKMVETSCPVHLCERFKHSAQRIKTFQPKCTLYIANYMSGGTHCARQLHASHGR